jgi:hypothetical protein
MPGGFTVVHVKLTDGRRWQETRTRVCAGKWHEREDLRGSERFKREEWVKKVCEEIEPAEKADQKEGGGEGGTVGEVSVEAKMVWDVRERDEGKIAELTKDSEDHEAKKSGEFQGRDF